MKKSRKPEKNSCYNVNNSKKFCDYHICVNRWKFKKLWEMIAYANIQFNNINNK